MILMKVKQLSLDGEWVELVKQAKTLGIPIEDVRLFIRTVREENNVYDNYF
ncbi:hypothetical protein J32TS6_37400 [Virgibacillus pantothenticus]|nr:hypothetical protein J32TS6_37400 [Virgibacillus pantothenticus]